MIRTLIIALLLLISVLPAIAQFHVDTLVQSPAIKFPVTLSFPPDGSNRLYFTEKNKGNVRIVRNDTLLPDPYISVNVTSLGEQGLLGFTFHPQFPDSPYTYVYYTRIGDSANVLVRYTDSSGIGVKPVQLLIIPRLANFSNHNGGNIHFGPDGKLYVSVGDYNINVNSQDTSNSNKRGKIHRFNSDGSIPADNPFPGNSLFVYGCRNSFDFTFDKLTGQMYASENGPLCNDEVNRIVAGRNYGWPVDGNCRYSNSSLYERPLYYWPLPPSVTGILVYRDSVFPHLNGKILVTCFNLGKIFQLTLNATGDSVLGEAKNLAFFNSSLIDIESGPDGNLYVANATYQGTSRIFRLRPAIMLPPVPRLVSPAQFAFNQSVHLALSWNVAPETEYYDLQISRDSSFSSVDVELTSQYDTLIQAAGLQYSTNYFWRVRGRNHLGSGGFSEFRQFTTVIEPPAQPQLLSPESNATNQPVSLTLRWNATPRAESYSIKVALDSLLAQPLYSFQNVVDTVQYLPALNNAILYYWNVVARNAGGSSMSSLTGKFTTIIPQPAKPQLFLPENFSTEEPLPVTLYWNTVNYASQYHIQISRTAFFNSLIYEDSTLTRNQCSPDTLLLSTTYYWRVRSKNFAGISEWSSVRNFKTEMRFMNINKGWNLLSLPVKARALLTASLFPNSVSPALEYHPANGYFISESLYSGKGYWMKFDSSETIPLTGKDNFIDTLDLIAGWNCIGSAADTIVSNSIQTIPPDLLEGKTFEFNYGFSGTTTIAPGKGYWVKSLAPGKLILDVSLRKKKQLLQKENK